MSASSPAPKTRTVISFLGTVLDNPRGAGRWQKWRPNIALHQQTAQRFDRLELFYSEKFRNLAELVRADLAQAAPHLAVNLVPLELANPWDFGEVYTKLHDWAAAYPFDTESEEYFTHITTGTHVAQICLFLLVESRRIPGFLLQTAPPKRQRHSMDQGDFGTIEIIDLDLARYDAIARRLAAESDDAVRYLKSGIATRNADFNRMIAEIEQVALNSPAPILLSGPTGAGKSMLARRIYEIKKARRQLSGSFVDVNCATLRGDGAASALFGHKKGAFTGAAEKREGYLKTADGGLLFLDEIGELGLDEQAMLLKAIEEKRFYPVGSDRESESRFQLIAGTNRDLRREAAAGRFREDLLARINIWHYRLPALAERREDIEPNIDHQLAVVSQELGRATRFNKEARSAYLAYTLSEQALWRGNFRDLAASIMRLATLAPQGRIGSELVAAEIERLQWQWQDGSSDSVFRQPENPSDTAFRLPADRERPSENHPAIPEQAHPYGQPETPVGRICRILEAKGLSWDEIDRFDQLQLAAVAAECRRHKNLAAAGRALYQASRLKRSTPNDSDRLRKYLQRFGLEWADVAE